MKNPFRSILISFVIMLFCVGCITTRTISTNSIPSSGKYHYIVHGDAIFPLDRVTISNDILTGYVNFSKTGRRNTINLYTDLNYAMKIDSNNITILPLHEITRVELKKAAPFKTGLSILGSLVLLDSIFSFLLLTGGIKM